MIIWFEEKYGFPRYGSAVDGLHIQISALLEQHDYYNRKEWYPFILQGLVHHFTDVYTV